MISVFLILALGAVFQDVSSFSLEKRTFQDESNGKERVPKILNGELAKAGEFPFIVSLQSDGDHFCGGSVISKYWIVTAAHCFPGKELSDSTKARSGTLKYNDGGTVHDLEQLIVHSDFNEGSQFNNDIALLKVREPFEDRNVKPVRIAKSKDVLPEGTEVISAGWGVTTKNRYSSSSVDLLRVTLDVVDREKCDNLPGIRALRDSMYRLKVSENMICARSEEKDTCAGDSGGPLLHGEGDEQVLVGIVSWGEGTGDMASPGVYTDVAKYDEWIHKNAQIEEEQPSHKHYKIHTHVQLSLTSE